MTKKESNLLAGAIKKHNDTQSYDGRNHKFTPEAIEALADFCQSQNPSFNRKEWLAYIKF